MTADLNAMDNSLSASSLPPSDPNQTTPFVCSYVPRGPPSGPTTYSLPTTPESNLSFATKLSFAKDSMLAKLGLGTKSEAQLAEEKLEEKREAERQLRIEARKKQGKVGASQLGFPTLTGF